MYKMKKVQIKYASLQKNNRFKLYLQSNHYTDRKGTKVKAKKYSSNAVDVFAIYVPELDKCFYVDGDILKTHTKSFTIKVDDSKKYERFPYTDFVF